MSEKAKADEIVENYKTNKIRIYEAMEKMEKINESYDEKTDHMIKLYDVVCKKSQKDEKEFVYFFEKFIRNLPYNFLYTPFSRFFLIKEKSKERIPKYEEACENIFKEITQGRVLAIKDFLVRSSYKKRSDPLNEKKMIENIWKGVAFGDIQDIQEINASLSFSEHERMYAADSWNIVHIPRLHLKVLWGGAKDSETHEADIFDEKYLKFFNKVAESPSLKFYVNQEEHVITEKETGIDSGEYLGCLSFDKERKAKSLKLDIEDKENIANFLRYPAHVEIIFCDTHAKDINEEKEEDIKTYFKSLKKIILENNLCGLSITKLSEIYKRYENKMKDEGNLNKYKKVKKEIKKCYVDLIDNHIDKFPEHKNYVKLSERAARHCKKIKDKNISEEESAIKEIVKDYISTRCMDYYVLEKMYPMSIFMNLGDSRQEECLFLPQAFDFSSSRFSDFLDSPCNLSGIELSSFAPPILFLSMGNDRNFRPWYSNEQEFSEGKYKRMIEKYEMKEKDAIKRIKESYIKARKYEIEGLRDNLPSFFRFNEKLEEGNKFLIEEKDDEALECFDEALKINPNCEQAFNKKGLALLGLGRHEQALECFNDALNIHPKFKNALNNKGLALLRNRNYEQALECFDKVLKLSLSDKRAINNKEIALMELGRYEEAFSSADEILKEDPSNTDIWNIKGMMFFNMIKYRKALKCFNKAIKIEPDFEEAWNNKGSLLGQRKKYKKALKCFDKVLEKNPNRIDCLNNKGNVFLCLRRYPDAMEYFDKALELNLKNEHAWNNKGVVFLEIGNYEEALECFNESLKINPAFEKAQHNKDAVENMFELISYRFPF